MNWDNIKLVVAIGSLASLMIVTVIRNQKRQISDIEINIKGSAYGLLDHETVDKLLILKEPELSKKAKVGVDLKLLETAIERISYIKSAEVFLSISGVLHVEFEEREPIARLFGGEEGYVDASGFKMPLSQKSSLRLPVVDLSDCKRDLADIAQLASYVHEDENLKKMVTAFGCDTLGRLTFQTRVWNNKVILGDLDKMSYKMKKFLAFYQRAHETDQLSAYQTVNLAIGNQVVGIKN